MSSSKLDDDVFTGGDSEGNGVLYSLNRLNVATSRARCACILVASPKLFEPECRSPRQMQLANAFCRYLELARTVADFFATNLRCQARNVYKDLMWSWVRKKPGQCRSRQVAVGGEYWRVGALGDVIR